MASEKDSGLNVETLYKQWSNFPAKAIFTPSLKVGALTGTTGLLAGSVAAVLRSSPTPTLFALVSGFQWFALGSTFTATRSTLLWHWDLSPSATPQDRIAASSYAGGITGGTVSGLIRGRSNVVPAAIMFSLFGYVGQTVYNKLDARHSEQVEVRLEQGKEEKRGFWQRVAEMQWSPLKALSDEEYASILREKVVGIEADIALLDEKMEELKHEERSMRGSQGDEAVVKAEERRRKT